MNTDLLQWTTVDSAAGYALATVASSPGIHGFGTTELPQPLQHIPSVCSYYASVFSGPLPFANGVTVGGEMLVARTHGGMTKNYPYAFGTSSNGQTVFAGPFKYFPFHHVSSGQHVAVSSLFGHTPFSAL